MSKYRTDLYFQNYKGCLKAYKALSAWVSLEYLTLYEPDKYRTTLLGGIILPLRETTCLPIYHASVLSEDSRRRILQITNPTSVLWAVTKRDI